MNIRVPTVRMLNINYGHNKQLMEKCRAVDACIEKGILKEFLLKNRAEVLGMLLEEFDAEKYERTIREEGREEGRIEGRKEGRGEGLTIGIRCSIEILREFHQSRDETKKKLIEKYAISESEAERELQLYWK